MGIREQGRKLAPQATGVTNSNRTSSGKVRHEIWIVRQRAAAAGSTTCHDAGFVGFAVDFFDIYLPALVLAPVMSYFEPKGLSSTAATTIYYFTIVATLLGRPCGAVIFGHWADKIGRRLTTMVSIAGFGVFTALIAFLPSDSMVGVWSLILLIVIRFVGGVFMGGEYTSNNTLALEMVPRDRRGFVGGLIQAAFPVGFALTTVVTTVMLSITTKDQYYAWGWRVPFLIGFAIAFAFLLYYRTVPEIDIVGSE